MRFYPYRCSRWWSYALAATGDERQRKRKANFEAAMEKLKEGNVGAATEFFQVLKSQNVEFIVVPYEADAQLAYLSSLDLEQGGIAAVITEDSDLLAYGSTGRSDQISHSCQLTVLVKIASSKLLNLL